MSKKAAVRRDKDVEVINWIRVKNASFEHEEMAEEFQEVLHNMGISVHIELDDGTRELYIELEVFIVTEFGWVQQVKSYIKPVLQAQKKSKGNIDIECRLDKENNFLLLR